MKYAAAAAVMQFNGGASMGVRIQESLGTPLSESSVSTLLRKDLERVKQLEKASQEKEKKRAVIQQLCTAREEAYKEVEGTSYESGAF